jgi:hypothetical protein
VQGAEYLTTATGVERAPHLWSFAANEEDAVGVGLDRVVVNAAKMYMNNLTNMWSTADEGMDEGF